MCVAHNFHMEAMRLAHEVAIAREHASHAHASWAGTTVI
jgi:hypothetical protein